jgi:hypothetical protein
MPTVFSYATYDSCRSFDIPPIPWMWGECWVLAQMDPYAEKIAKLLNTPSGNYMEIYERTPQPHPFINLLSGTGQLLYHTLKYRLNGNDFSMCHEKINQVISWDSAIIFMDVDKRRPFWTSMERCMAPGGKITVAFNHFFRVSDAAALYMNSKVFRELNHHFRANFQPSDLDGAGRIWNEILSSGGFHLFRNIPEKDLFRKTDVMCIPYFDLIDPKCFPDTDEAKSCLKEIFVSAIGIDITLET